jgi:tetratricopeptide (TPR) repeat protein
MIYKNAGEVDRAVQHYNEGIRYAEAGNNFYKAGMYRYNVALMLAQQGRFADARAYARAALRDFQQYQGRAADMEEQTRELIAQIEQAMRGSADNELGNE